MKRLLWVLPVLALFLSCSRSVAGTGKILLGVYQWHRNEFSKAEESFLSAAQKAEADHNEKIASYALYGLAVTYLAEGNDDAAAERFNALTGRAFANIRFAASYNSGIIAARGGNYEKAAEFFKEALIADSGRVDAKINLELARDIHEQEARGLSRELIPVSPGNTPVSAAEQAVFSLLKEMEQNQWKNSSSEQPDSTVIDY